MSMVEDLSWASLLWAHIWQVTLLAMVAATAHRLWALNRPHLAHAIWVLVLLKCVMPPVVSSPVSPFSWLNSYPPTSHDVEALSTEKGGLARVAADLNRSSPWWQADSRSAGDSLVHQTQVVKRIGEVGNLNRPGSLLFGGDAQANYPWNGSNQQEGGTTAVDSGGGDGSLDGLGWSSSWSQWAVALWSVGVCGSLLVALIRSVRFHYWICQHQMSGNSHQQIRLQQIVDRLSGQLQLRRPVRLMILNCSVGPAVTGLWHPTILIPAVLLDGRDGDLEPDLEPLLAHELVHIRRGDLWWAMLQTISQSIFWFHPIIWWANAMVTRESERSCDEETVALLKCSPKRYANSLIDVLELKHRLRVAPVVPGVRPVDITTARLERVMKLGNGCLNRTPHWIWGVMIVSGMIVLPGAALAWTQQEPVRLPIATAEVAPKTANQKSAENKANPNSAVTRLPTVNQKYSGPQQVHKVMGERPPGDQTPKSRVSSEPMDSPGQVLPRAYYIPDDIQYFPKEHGFKLQTQAQILQDLQESQADTKTLPRLPQAKSSPRLAQTDSLPRLPQAVQWYRRDVGDLLKLIASRDLNGKSPEACFASALIGSTAARPEATEKQMIHLVLTGEKLEVRANAIGIRRVDQQLENWRKYGIDAVIVETRFVSMPRELLNSLEIDWDMGETALGSSLTESKQPARSDKTVGAEKSVDQVQLISSTVTEQPDPTFHTVVSDKKLRGLFVPLSTESRVSITQSPTLFLNHGQPAKISDQAMRPFVVELRRASSSHPRGKGNLQPVVKLFPEGRVLEVSTRPGPAGDVLLGLNIEVTKIDQVNTLEIPIGGAKIQQPRTIKTEIMTTQRLTSAKNTALLYYFDETSKGTKVANLIAVTTRHLPFEKMYCQTGQTKDNNSSGSATSQPIMPGKPLVAQPNTVVGMIQQPRIDWLIEGKPERLNANDAAPTAASSSEEAQTWLKQLGLSAKVQGNVIVRFSEDRRRMTIAGDKLAFNRNEMDEVSFSGDGGEITIDRTPTSVDGKPAVIQKLEFQFERQVKAVLYGMRVQAKSGTVVLELKPATNGAKSDEQERWDFHGDVLVDGEGVSMTGDRIQMKTNDKGNTEFLISGNGSFKRDRKGQEKMSIGADNIRWVPEENSFSSFSD